MRYAIIAGNGITSRNNVEALVEDFLYIPDKNVTLLFPYNTRLSDGQAYASQFVSEAGFPVLTFSAKSHSNPFEAAFEEVGSAEAKVLLLWDDDDEECLNVLKIAKDKGIKSYDLCQGLIAIEPSESIDSYVAPVVPPQESRVVVDEETVESDSDDDELEQTDADIIYDAIALIADMFAEALAEKIAASLVKHRGLENNR